MPVHPGPPWPPSDSASLLCSLNLRSFRLPSSQITPLPDVGVQVSVSNAFAQLTGNWRWKRGLL